MELSPEQTETVRQWVADGQSLSQIQKGLSATYGLNLTYMDVRFLVDDLELNLQDKPEPQSAAQDLSKQPAPEGNGMGMNGGSVSVTLDQVMRPGAVISGTVTFPDGVSAQWYLDQMGRLGFNPSQEGYQPSPEDMQEFQVELQNLLQKKGF